MSAEAKRVADIFFSYSRGDRERVGIVRNALAEMGFEVFWDQVTPSGSDWDTWIRGELAKSKCAVVFWSETSIVSDNVRHEAVVAKEQRKLISVFLDQLPARDLPIGFYSQQAADLSKWDGDQEDAEWRKFRGEFEAKLMPRWVHQKLNRVDAELEGERARRETAEAHEKTLRAQISKEAKTQQNLKGERDRALTEVGELRAAVEERDREFQTQTNKQLEIEQTLKGERDNALAEAAKLGGKVEELTQAHSDDQKRLVELSQRLSEAEMQQSEHIRERDSALAEVAGLKAAVEGLSRARPDDGARDQTKGWLNPIAVGIVLLAAVLGGTLVSLWRAPDRNAEQRADQATSTLAASDAARQAAEAKATDAEKARQAATAKADDAEKARQAATAKAAEADKARQAAEVKADQTTAALGASERARQAAEAKAADADKARQAAVSRADDANRARQAAEAKVDQVTAALAKLEQARQAAEAKAAGTVTSGPASPGGQFSRRSNMEAREAKSTQLLIWVPAASIIDCEQNCARSNTCKVYTYNKKSGACFMYSVADLVPNEYYDSGIRN